MIHEYTLTKSINNKIFQLGILYGRISFLQNNFPWKDNIISSNLVKSGIAAVSIDKNILENIGFSKVLSPKDLKDILGEENYKNFKRYNSAKEKKVIKYNKKTLDLDCILEIHNTILGSISEKTSMFRNYKRILPKEITENGIIRNIQLEVKTKPSEIETKLNLFINWFNTAIPTENPFILSGLTHFYISEIHPFSDGNGRLGRLLEYLVLSMNDIEVSYAMCPEYYYLLHNERYYDLIEKAIASQNLTEWLEFYTEILLNSMYETIKAIYHISAGTIDIKNNKFIILTELETKILNVMIKDSYATISDISKKLGYSRQNIYLLLKDLYHKGVLEKIGQNTGARYRLKNIS